MRYLEYSNNTAIPSLYRHMVYNVPSDVKPTEIGAGWGVARVWLDSDPLAD